MARPEILAHYEELGKKVRSQPFRVAVSDFYTGKKLLEKECQTG